MVEEFQQGNSVDLSYMVSGNLDVDTEAQQLQRPIFDTKSRDFISFEELNSTHHDFSLVCSSINEKTV